MNTKKIGRGFVILTIFVAVIVLGAIAIQRTGLAPLVSIMSSIVGVLGGALAMLEFLERRGEQAGGTTPPPPEGTREPRQPVAQPRPTDSRRRSTEERVNEMQEEWYNGGKHKFPNVTAYIARKGKRVLEYLPLEAHHIRWGERIAVGVGVLAYLWLMMIAGRILDENPLIELPEMLRSLIYAVPLPQVEDPLTGIFIYMIVPGAIVFLVLLFYSAKRDATCPDCGESFALRNLGCFYEQEGRETRSKTVNETEYTWTEYEGKQALKCTECGEFFTDDAFWKSNDGLLGFLR